MANIQARQYQKTYHRFSPHTRMEHFILIIAFTMLGVTGLIQRYAEYDLAKDVIALLGGIESVRFLHRFFAVMLIAGSIYHAIALAYRFLVRGSRLTMLPTLKDATDALQVFLYNLGLRKTHPRMPKYNFGEKAEYLALVWGTLLMIVTGFMLWNPIAATTFLPGTAIPIARYAHSAEALLAILSIIIWHMYNVHIKHFNRAMFTGRISHEEMVEEHGAELEAMQEGRVEQLFPEEVRARRHRLFVPIATVVMLVMLAGLFYFVTYEETAIETTPRLPVAVGDIDPAIGDPALGAVLWSEHTCSPCHGELGEGVPPIPRIRQTALDIDAFARAIRVGPADMPAYPPAQVSDEGIAHLYAYLTNQRP